MKILGYTKPRKDRFRQLSREIALHDLILIGFPCFISSIVLALYHSRDSGMLRKKCGMAWDIRG